MMTIEEERAWAAGLFEGEGSFSPDRRSLKMQLVMTDEDIVRRFADIVGVGNVRGPYMYNNSKVPIWRWCVGLAGARTCMDLFGRMLGERRRQRFSELEAQVGR